MRENPLVNDQFYHVFNRGVNKQQIFASKRDYYRFLRGMYEFNDENCAEKFFWPLSGVGKPITRDDFFWEPDPDKERIKLVEIICYCLMPNHFHFILKQLREGGISLFMKKLGGGFANYVNLKYDRCGPLFQGRFKAKLIKTDSQLLHLSRYIHLLNPGELVEPKIREGVIKDKSRLEKFVKNYKWSSYSDYLEIGRHPAIDKDFVMNYFKDAKDYEKFVMDWVAGDLGAIEDLMIE